MVSVSVYTGWCYSCKQYFCRNTWQWKWEWKWEWTVSRFVALSDGDSCMCCYLFENLRGFSLTYSSCRFLLSFLFMQNMQAVLVLDQICQWYARFCSHYVLTLITLFIKLSKNKDTRAYIESDLFQCSEFILPFTRWIIFFLNTRIACTWNFTYA